MYDDSMSTDADQIQENAVDSPAEVETDMGRARQHPIQDQIAADQYARTNGAMQNGHRGLRFNKLKPPGA